jgi:hypothetical protein
MSGRGAPLPEPEGTGKPGAARPPVQPEPAGRPRWRYDPAALAWTARVGPSRWLIVPGDLDDPPRVSPPSVI